MWRLPRLKTSKNLVSISVCRFKALFFFFLISKLLHISLVETLLYHCICRLSLSQCFLLRYYIFRCDVRYKYFYVCSLRSHIHTYIAEAGFINIHPTLSAATHSFRALLFILFHHLGDSSLCPSVCPHYRRMTREEVNLRTVGDVGGKGGALWIHASISSLLAILTTCIFLVVPLLFCLLLFASFLFHFC